MKVTEIKKVMSRNSGEIAFIIGNGINHYFSNSTASWNDLLLYLWKKHSFSTRSEIPPGISFTEFYDALEIENFATKNFSGELQKDVRHLMKKWSAGDEQNGILECIRDLNAPVLTTNFDDLIPKTMDLDIFKTPTFKFSDFYPWSNYYSDVQQSDPLNGFSVWYINGMIHYHRSIKLGLSHYMGNVQHARNMIPFKMVETGALDQVGWRGNHTWLNIIFNKSLFIIGLGLDEGEVFLRWLLIQRAKYFRKNKSKKRNGWFLVQDKDGGSVSEGKRFFLNSVGFEVLTVNSYQDMYEDIWK